MKNTYGGGVIILIIGYFNFDSRSIIKFQNRKNGFLTHRIVKIVEISTNRIIGSSDFQKNSNPQNMLHTPLIFVFFIGFTSLSRGVSMNKIPEQVLV